MSTLHQPIVPQKVEHSLIQLDDNEPQVSTSLLDIDNTPEYLHTPYPSILDFEKSTQVANKDVIE